MLQTMAENISWDPGLGTEAVMGFIFFYMHLQVVMYSVMAATFYHHADPKSPASNLFFGILSILSFLSYVLHLFPVVRIYVSRCIPPHPHFL